MVARIRGKPRRRSRRTGSSASPRHFAVYRTVGGEVLGFLAHLRFRQPCAEDITADPAIQVAADFIARHGPLRQDEEILYGRYWMGRGEEYIPPILNLAAINTSIDYTTTPKVAWNFIAMSTRNSSSHI